MVELMLMYRSFTDRVLGGVCGGWAVSLRVNAWVLRVAFVVLILASQGVGLLLYLGLWWLMPQESLIEARHGSPGRLLLILLFVIGIIAVWVGHLNGVVQGSDGQTILWPVILVIVSSTFLLRQIFR